MVPPPASPLINRVDGTPYFLPHVIKTIGGVRVGIIGINVVGKTKNASKPNPSTIFEDEAQAAQRSIDELKSQGVKHIILMTHIGYENDVALAQKLTDVDIIIGGDSHTFLGNYSHVVRKTPAGNYPTIVKNKSGDIVCIGQAWEYTKVFAQMNVKFNDDGSVRSCGGTSAIVIGDVFFSDRDLKVPLPAQKNKQIQAKLKNVIDVRVSSEDFEFNRQIRSYNAAYDQDTQIQIGTQQGDQSLCLIRVPGTKNRGGPICDSVANLASGSDITQVVTEGYRKAAEQSSDPFIADFALTNAGGIRKELETDGVNDRILRMEDIFAIQPFPNELIMIQITGLEMKLALEQGVQNWADHGNSDGSHPYASGLRWHLDLSKKFGARFSNIEVKDPGTGSWSILDPNAKYKLVVTDYLRDGAENYLIFRDICLSPNSNRCLPLGGIYATDSFAEYIKKLIPKKIARPKCEDYSHQDVIKKDGAKLTYCH
jgi:5'-nucleotidase/UDP-sugar diphosphatase